MNHKFLSTPFLVLKLKAGLPRTPGQRPTRLMDQKTSTQRRAPFLEFLNKSLVPTPRTQTEKLRLPIVTNEEKPVLKALASLVKVKTKGKVRAVRGLLPTAITTRSCLDLRVKPVSSAL